MSMIPKKWDWSHVKLMATTIIAVVALFGIVGGMLYKLWIEPKVDAKVTAVIENHLSELDAYPMGSGRTLEQEFVDLNSNLNRVEEKVDTLSLRMGVVINDLTWIKREMDR